MHGDLAIHYEEQRIIVTGRSLRLTATEDGRYAALVLHGPDGRRVAP